MDAPLGIRYVDTPAVLDALCVELAGHPWLALDTEFIREDTYFPKLCMIQVAIPGITACIDTLALPRLGPLLERLHDPAVTKILHASHQDMEIFYHLSDGRLPGPVFDTQLAAPLLGGPGQASYAGLVSEILGIKLDKAHARTDWSRRPLSQEQIEYAADDVRYLGPLYLELRTRLVALGRLEWLEEDCLAVCDPARYENTPEAAWKRVRGARYLAGPQLRLLRMLAAWREVAARAENRPRGWLLRDDALLDIANSAPHSREQLAELPSVSRRAAERHGAAVLEIIRSAPAVDSPDDEAVAGTERLTDQEKSLLRRMTGLVRRKAGELSVDAAAIATRRDLLELLRGEPTSPLLSGWRRTVIATELLDLLPDEARNRIRASD
jgi:ribonuclease D